MRLVTLYLGQALVLLVIRVLVSQLRMLLNLFLRQQVRVLWTMV